MRARARRQEELHLRITKAAVHLHGSVGPARTTVSQVARLAGVRRATVYNHFPTDLDLFDACSSHWFSENPPPVPSDWARIADPRVRVQSALEALYEYYDRGRDMLRNVLRDTPLVPAVEQIMKLKWWPLLDRMVEILAQDLPAAAPTNAEAGAGRITPAGRQATLRVVLDFFTWQTFSACGLSNREATNLAVAWLESASSFEDRSAGSS